MPEGLIADTFVTPQQREAEALVRRQYPNLELVWNPLTGTPRSLYTLDGFLTAPTPVAGPQILLGFVARNSELFRLEPEDLEAFSVSRETVSPGSPVLRRRVSTVRHVALDQRFQDRQVYPATLVGSVTARGELVNLSGEVVPDLAAAVNAIEPTLSALEALERAAASVTASFTAADHPLLAGPEGPERRQTFAGGSDFSADVPVRLIYFVVARDDVRLVWEVTLGTAGDVYSYQVMVDAQDGSTLYRETITDSDTPQWRVYSEILNTPTEHARDDMHPLDNPAPLSPGPATPDGSQGAEIAAVLAQTNGDPAFSPDGWITEGTDTPTGNNVVAFVDLDNDSTADPGEQPTASLVDVGGEMTRTFDFPFDSSRPPDDAGNEAASATNAFFMANWYHDRLYELGFDEAAGNFQDVNFTPDGVAGDRVKARLHVGTDNSRFSTPAADGTCCPTLNAYTWTGPEPDRDSGLDQEVLIHEFTHGLSNRIIGGPNVKGLSGSGQPGGLGEGYSDIYSYLLLSRQADPAAGNYAVGGYLTFHLNPAVFFDTPADWEDNYYFGIRHFPYSTDLCVNPFTLVDMQPATYDITPIPAAGCGDSPPVSPWLELRSGGLHDMGEIWAATFWEVRAKLVADHGWAVGNELALQLITDSLFLLGQDPTFIEARDAVLMADLARTGGANLCRIWEGFAKRGLGVGAQTPTMGAFVEDFTEPGGDCRPLMDLVLVLDFSSSMNSPEACSVPPQDIKLEVLKQAVPAFLNAWEPFAVEGDRVGVMYFDDDADPRTTPLLEDLLANKAAILADVAMRPTGTFTALGPGVLSTADSFDNAVRKRHMIVLSDGIQNVNPLIVSAGDVDADGVEEHEVVTSPEAWGGDSPTVPERPGDFLDTLGIPMHTLSIGSAPGTTYDELLAAIAEETEGLHQHTCVPEVELEEFLTNSLVTALQGDTVELVGYETGTLESMGASGEHRFGINGSAYRAAFLLSWSGGSGEAGDVDLRLFAPDGREVPTAGWETTGASFRRVTLDFPLFLPDRSQTPEPVLFVGEWRVAVERRLSGQQPILYRTYLLVDDAALEYDLAIDEPVVATGRPIPLSVRVTEGGAPLDPSSIVVTVDRPGTGVGNLIREAGLSDADRTAITTELGVEELRGSPLMQTYEAAFRDPANAARLRPVRETVPFFDDGLSEHGDARTGDGVYSALFRDTTTPGEYQFHFTVAGESEFHGPYRREKTASATVVLRLASETEFDLTLLDRIEGQERFRVLVTPRDEFGNYLGPGYAESIVIALDGATPVGPVEDRLDGTYAQTFRTADLGRVSGEALVFDTRLRIPSSLLQGGSPATRSAWSIHAGWVDPRGPASSALDPGFTLNLDRVFPIRSDLAWDLRLGLARFDGVTGAPDLDVWMLLGNLKYAFYRGSWDLFVNGGGGLYVLDPGDAEGGVNLGVGAARELSPALVFEATVNYHAVLTASPDLEFLQGQVGLLFSF
jgi:hypothetical protein